MKLTRLPWQWMANPYYVMPVKANQKSFLDDIRTLFKPLTTGESSIQADQSTQKYTRCSLRTSGGLSRNS